MAENTLDPENIFSILLSTDNHLGYGEKKPIIQQDSFRTFEEILQIAVKNEVDMILLGGDLFHDVQPSSHTIYKCTELLKRYCLGDKPVAIEFLSDPSVNFQHLKNPMVNYEDPNLNVSIPVFSIHGNHDNPSGALQISGLDVIASSGLINYFGRWTNIKKVIIRPVLLRKGTTKVAIYGLSHIPDQRLARLFQERKVTISRPEGDDWFHILVLHQNRANRGNKNYIPTDLIPSFINLVVWGHEHDCDITETKLEHGPWLTQPGSSVATSLSEGEAQEKHVGVLQIVNQKFKIIPVPLVTVRPLMVSEIILKCPDTDDDYNPEDPKTQAIADVKAKVAELIEQAKQKQEQAGAQPLIPFVRLMVKYYSETQVFNANQLGFDYEDVVANAPDIFKLADYKIKGRTGKLNLMAVDDDEFAHMDQWAVRVEDVVERYFENHNRAGEMKVLSAKVLTKAVQKFVDTDDAEAISYAVDMQEKAVLEKLIAINPNFEDIDKCLDEINEQRLQEESKEIAEDVVANAPDIFKLADYKLKGRTGKLNLMAVDDDEFAHMDQWAVRVEDVVERYFENHNHAGEIKVLSAKVLTKAVQKFVDTDHAEAISYAVDMQEKAVLEKLIAINPNFEGIDKCLDEINEQRLQEEDKEIVELLKALDNPNRPSIGQQEVILLDEDNDSDVDAPATSPSKPARGRGSRGGRTAGASTSTTRGGRRGRRATKN